MCFVRQEICLLSITHIVGSWRFDDEDVVVHLE